MSKMKCFMMFALAFTCSVALFASGSGEHIEFLSFIGPEACFECDTETLGSVQNEPLTPPVITPPVNVNVVSLLAEVQGVQYCVFIIPEIGPSTQFACVGISNEDVRGLLPSIGPIALVEVAGQTVEATAADIALAIRFVEDRLFEQVTTASGTIWTPVDFGDPDAVAWFLQNGGKVTLDLDVALKNTSGVIQTVSTQVPLVGQAVRAALKTAGN